MERTTAPSPTLRFLLRATLLTALLSAAAAWPVHAGEGAEGLRALLLAAGAALVGAAAGRLPRLWIPASRPEAPVLAAMAGFGVRLIVTAALAFAVVALALVPRILFGLCVAGFYLALLLLEVREAIREVAPSVPAPRAPGGAV